jgi:hypothetical protein
MWADQTTSASVVRTGGASDGTTPVSHKVATTSLLTTTNLAASAGFHNAIPLTIWNAVTGTNRNVTLYGIVNATAVPYNDEVWMDVEYLGSATTPQGSFATSAKANILSSHSALTADSSSAWDSAATAWQSNHTYSAGDIIKASTNPGRLFFCTAGGTSTNGSIPGGYASAVDGGVVTDNGATFRAGCRFSITVTLSSPQPQEAGYLYVYPKFAKASTTYFLDPEPYLS